MKRFLSLVICLFFFCGLIYSVDSRFIIVIDPGHGGKDAGAVRGNYKEKDINLAVALELGRLIEKNYKDVKVVYTRKADIFIDLDRRAEIANKAKANLFISIHTNSTASRNTDATGADTYILGLARSAENLAVAKRENSVILLEDNYKTKYEGFDPNSPESYIIFEFMTNKYMEQSLQFGTFVQRDFKDVARRTDRGIRQAGFLVLRKTSSPSVLIELGFINNLAEAKFLSSQLGQQAMATAIYSGFRKYKRNFDKMQGKLVVDDREEIIMPNIDDIEEIDMTTVDTLPKNDIIYENKKATSSVSNATKTAQSQNKDQIEYRVQFLYSDTKLSNNSASFKGLSPVGFYREGKGYKYTYGSTTNFDEILKIQGRVRKQFKDAFVVKFKNGQRIK